MLISPSHTQRGLSASARPALLVGASCTGGLAASAPAPRAAHAGSFSKWKILGARPTHLLLLFSHGSSMIILLAHLLPGRARERGGAGRRRRRGTGLVL